MKPKQIFGVPDQEKGGSHDTESHRQFDDSASASKNFEILKQRFFSINSWKKYTGENSADFRLYDSAGKAVKRSPEIGDFIRIDIPGPGEIEAKGYDWVEVVNWSHQLSELSEYFIMTCRPSKIPGNKNNDHIAHFYSEQSTSTFIISKENNELTAGIYGRNEVPNSDAELMDKIRNVFIAVGGMIGISKIQWKALADGLLDFD
ncbi:hypothetical protein CEY12_21515 [Chryseobacterium sp. T16E-39]|uniref:hypothetical protein n=1 Tax=Chryseobacterium sp. T16E-39 TaxID=2015076 RepID=UPI000B5B41EA|nr:hypothetical protein [Chryseobacterium sp. T16E-39]ASK32503.1 hypothetical protein CEY12_21515 [Chryseobacterium sp. T16E-39]